MSTLFNVTSVDDELYKTEMIDLVRSIKHLTTPYQKHLTSPIKRRKITNLEVNTSQNSAHFYS
ncbi:CLUMA_CG013294, isoform A [Clunio marinus]|uniref:CLUMA_CG013294, isoform A n=1 Tax=Clunio marinus TaxID=568069 RepID=A0A1J1IKD5_9DIPT|nr:CLUMA_CG013294, isoform A [Clunio marinus]